jgi:hypothetical protein
VTLRLPCSAVTWGCFLFARNQLATFDVLVLGALKSPELALRRAQILAIFRVFYTRKRTPWHWWGMWGVEWREGATPLPHTPPLPPLMRPAQAHARSSIMLRLVNVLGLSSTRHLGCMARIDTWGAWGCYLLPPPPHFTLVQPQVLHVPYSPPTHPHSSFYPHAFICYQLNINETSAAVEVLMSSWAWLNETTAAQKALADHDAPVLTSDMLKSKVADLKKKLNPLHNRPRPTATPKPLANSTLHQKPFLALGGFLTPLKVPTADVHGALDTDKDGKLPKSEWLAQGGSEAHFTILDVDGDDHVSATELEAVHDKDGDGHLSIPEFIAASTNATGAAANATAGAENSTASGGESTNTTGEDSAEAAAEETAGGEEDEEPEL